MPAPELTTQTPGDTTANTAPVTETPAPAPLLYVAKHKGAGRWIAVTNDEKADQVGDFVGDKDTIIAEVERLNFGGKPLVLDPERTSEVKAPAQPSTVDATAIKQPVMTAEGWLCPEPPVKE